MKPTKWHAVYSAHGVVSSCAFDERDQAEMHLACGEDYGYVFALGIIESGEHGTELHPRLGCYDALSAYHANHFGGLK